MNQRINIDTRIRCTHCGLRTCWDRWQKMKDNNSFTELFASICEAKALEGKND